MTPRFDGTTSMIGSMHWSDPCRPAFHTSEGKTKGETQMKSTSFTWLAICLLVLLRNAGIAEAEDISGTIAVTKTILQDSQLVGNVICTMSDSPCIAFGASGIKLSLNGFTMRGPARPDAAPDPANPGASCNTAITPLADGISIVNRSDVQVLGPGMVQEFRRHGIAVGTTPAEINASTNVRIAHVTSHHNCLSGLFFIGMSNSVIEDVVSVSNQATFIGGGATIPTGSNTNNNLIRRNYFGGNVNTVNPNNPNASFGLNLGGSNNLIEDNTIVGNTHGLQINSLNVSGNVIRRNVIAGNRHILVQNPPDDTGGDIHDVSAVAGTYVRNTFQGNWCVTYGEPVKVDIRPEPLPCPNLTLGVASTTVPRAANLIIKTSSFGEPVVSAGGSFTAEFLGNNLTTTTYFDVRFRRPGSATDEFAINWQQGTTAIKPVGTPIQAGIWTITGVRAHQAINDAAGPYVAVTATLTVVP
jgi:hypothetical protein